MTPYWFWIKWGAALIVLALVVRFVYGKGYDACELKHLKAEQSLQNAAVKRAAALQKRLDNLPKAEGPHREVVRQNPAPCARPVPVADSLREAIHQANAARALPADS
jgi:hypothetical protein